MAREHDFFDREGRPHGWLRFPDVDEALTPAERAAVAAFDALSEAQQRAYLLGRPDRAGQRVRQGFTELLERAVDELAAAWTGTPRVQTVGGQPTGYRGIERQAELFYAKFMSKGGQRAFYRRANFSRRTMWLRAAPERRLRIVARFTAVPGTSRHHWGTDVDLSPVEPRPWMYGRNKALRQYLESAGGEHDLGVAYPDGRAAGYEYEPWHLTHVRLGPAMHRRYDALIEQARDVVPAALAAFDAWAEGRLSERERSAGHLALEHGLRRVDLWTYVDGVARPLVAWKGDVSFIG